MELIFVHGALVRDGQWWWQAAARLPPTLLIQELGRKQPRPETKAG